MRASGIPRRWSRSIDTRQHAFRHTIRHAFERRCWYRVVTNRCVGASLSDLAHASDRTRVLRASDARARFASARVSQRASRRALRARPPTMPTHRVGRACKRGARDAASRFPQTYCSCGFPVNARDHRECRSRAARAMRRVSRVGVAQRVARVGRMQKRAATRTEILRRKELRHSDGSREQQVSRRCSMHRDLRELVGVVRTRKFFCTFFLTSSNKRIMIRLDKRLTSLQRASRQKQQATSKDDRCLERARKNKRKSERKSKHEDLRCSVRSEQCSRSNAVDAVNE